MKYSNFINYSTKNVLNVLLYYINKMSFKNLENIMNLFNHVCFSRPTNMGYNFLLMCVVI